MVLSKRNSPRFCSSLWQFLLDKFILNIINTMASKLPNSLGNPNQILQSTGQGYSLVTLDKDLVGLGNVDNTSDINKPVSIFIQNELDLKENVSNRVSTLVGSSPNTYPSTLAVQTAIQNAQLGLNWRPPLELVNTMGESASVPTVLNNLDSFILLPGANTGAWSSFQAGDLVQSQDGLWKLIKNLTQGDRFGIAYVSTNTPISPFIGRKNQIVTVTSNTAGVLTYSYELPIDDYALFVDNQNAFFRNQSFVYSVELTQWVRLSGGIDYTFGSGLQSIGNIVSTNIGATNTSTVNMFSTGNSLSSNIRISNAAGNQVVANLDGIFVGDTIIPPETSITANTTSSISLGASGFNNHNLFANIRLSSLADNVILLQQDGIYVAPTLAASQTPITVNDSATIDFFASGIDNHTLTGDVRISSTLGNNTVANLDGLYTNVKASETVTTLSQNITNGVITYTNEAGTITTARLLSADASNIMTTGADGGIFLNTSRAVPNGGSINEFLTTVAGTPAWQSITASQIANVPSGIITSGTTQAAINELATRKTNKLRVVQSLVAGNNTITHNFGLTTNAVIVDVRNNTTGGIITHRIITENTNSTIINVATAVANARITIIG